MSQSKKDLEKELEKWRRGRATLEEIRSLPPRLGKSDFAPGIPVVLKLLDHEDEIVRYNAVVSLSFDFQYKPALQGLVKVLAEDPDGDCRDAAADGLAFLFRNSKNCVVLEALGNAALSDSDKDVRSAAYMALLNVNGVSDEEHSRMLRGPRRLVDPAQVNAILKEC